MTLQKPVTRSRPKVMYPGSAPSPSRWSVFTFPFIVQIINWYRKCAPTTTITATHLTSPRDEGDREVDWDWSLRSSRSYGRAVTSEKKVTSVAWNMSTLLLLSTGCKYASGKQSDVISAQSASSLSIVVNHHRFSNHTWRHALTHRCTQTHTLNTFQLASVTTPVQRACIVWLIMVQDKISSGKRINLTVDGF